MTWLYLSFGAALSFASLNLFSRVVSIKSKNPRAMSVVFNFIATLMALIIFFVSNSQKNFSLPTGYLPWIYLSIAVLFYGLYERLRFYISKAIEASQLTVIGNTSLLVAVIMAFFIYNESLTISKIMGFLLILIALILVSINKIKKIDWPGVSLAILANVFLGIAWALDKKGIQYFNSETYNVLVWLLPLIVLSFPYIKLIDIKREIKISLWKIFLLSFINVVGYFINLKALSLADVTRVLPIVQTSTIFTVVFGILFLKERENIPKKILAAVVAVFGVFLLR